MNGWIRLHRKFLEWEWFKVDEMVKIFIFLLLSANHQDGKWQGIEIKRGQLITGINSIHQKTGISHQTIRTCLKRLEKTGEINKQSTNKYSIITICKYDEYQDSEQATNKQTNKRITSNQQATNKQLTTNNNNNNDNNKNKEIIYPSGFEKIIEEWLKYKSEKKQTYKNSGLKTFINQLMKYSNNKPDKAKKIIEISMANNWSGIFPLRDGKNIYGQKEIYDAKEQYKSLD